MNEAAFLEAIAAEPHDDAHRLVFADWLDEHGDAVHSAFVRDQVELARADEADPSHPALLARMRRGGMLTRQPSRPMIDHVPGGRVVFRRGLIDAVRLSPAAFLRQPSDHWAQVPLTRLCLECPARSRGSAGEELSQREELRRVRTLCFEGRPRRGEFAPLLLDCPHLANLRDLSLTDGLANGTLVDSLALPALDSLAVHVGTRVGDWEAFVPRHGPPLRRIALTGQSDAGSSGNWQPPTLDWLLRSRHGSTLEEAYVRREDGDSPPGYGPTHTIPLRTASLLAKSRLRRVEMDGASAAGLPGVADWGGLEHLAIRGEISEQTLDGILASEQALRLRSLLIEPIRSDFESFELPRLLGASPPAWQCLRLVDWAPDLLKACSATLLRLSVNDLATDLTFAREGLSFPQLRSLLIDVDEPVRSLPKFVAGLGAANLCTLLVLGVETLRPSTLRSLARLEGMPHFSLVGAGGYGTERWWVLAGGEATRVPQAVLPLDCDWWDPLPDRPR